MTAAEARLARAVSQRAARLQPDLAAAILRAFAKLRDSMSEAQLARAIELGGPDRVVQELLAQAIQDVAMQPVREKMRYGVAQAAKITAKSIPVPQSVDRTLAFAFDFLNPRVVDAIRSLETDVITKLQEDTRETVRAYVENGLRDGVSPTQVARRIKSLIGLAPSQEQAVQNLARELSEGRVADAARRKLLDRRFNLSKLAQMSPEDRAQRIDTIVTTYRKRYVAQNAESTARTAALQSQKLGQKLSWDDATDKGIIDRARLMKQRIGVGDVRERPEHFAINNQVRHIDEPYSNGEMVSGDLSWNCRCVDRYFTARAA